MALTMTYNTINKPECCPFEDPNPSVPTFATAHTFCASRNGPRKSGFLTAVPAKTDTFLRFITTRKKKILARDTGIRKES